MSLANRLNNPSQHPIEDLTLPIGGAGDLRSGPVAGSLQLSNLKGRVIVLFILGINCGTCKHVGAQLSALHYKYAPEVSFLGICVQAGCQDKLAEFDRVARVSFPLAHCPTRELCPALGIPKATWLYFPTMIFIDQEQRLRGIFVGGDEYFDDLKANTREVLDKLLLESAQVERITGVSA